MICPGYTLCEMTVFLSLGEGEGLVAYFVFVVSRDHPVQNLFRNIDRRAVILDIDPAQGGAGNASSAGDRGDHIRWAQTIHLAEIGAPFPVVSCLPHHSFYRGRLPGVCLVRQVHACFDLSTGLDHYALYGDVAPGVRLSPAGG